MRKKSDASKILNDGHGVAKWLMGFTESKPMFFRNLINFRKKWVDVCISVHTVGLIEIEPMTLGLWNLYFISTILLCLKLWRGIRTLNPNQAGEFRK